MTSHDRRAQILAAVLAALAGYSDAIGFLATGGFFVSFMSGNSTRMGIGTAQFLQSGAIAGALIAAFLTGVVAGAIAGDRAGPRRRPVTLILVALLLAAAAAAGSLGVHPGAVALLAAAMGALNNVFARNGEVSLGVTYMTGSLVKLGQRIAAALLGRDRFGWLAYLSLWLSFVAGVVTGTLAFQHAGLAGLWCTPLVAAVLAAFEWRGSAPRPVPLRASGGETD